MGEKDEGDGNPQKGADDTDRRLSELAGRQSRPSSLSSAVAVKDPWYLMRSSSVRYLPVTAEYLLVSGKTRVPVSQPYR